MKIKTLWHKPCIDDIMSYLVPDLENSFEGLGKFKCMKCGQGGITLNDDCVHEVIGEPIDLYVIGNDEANQTLGISDNQITFASVDQAAMFADEVGLLSYRVCELGERGPLTNGNEYIESEDAK